MLSWLAHKLLSRNMAQLRSGNIKPLLRLDAKDVRFRFPGDSSWSGEFHGKEELTPWLKRFADVGLQIFADEVVLKGPPWRQTLCARGTDFLAGPDGRRVYENRYVIWGHLRWGLMRDYEVYEDTQKAAALDRYLEQREAAPAA